MKVDKDSLEIRKRSIFSTSAESLTSFDDSVSITTQEQLYENIRLHKEIIQSVKNQPWSLSKKYKIVQKVKQYITKHEDTLQERFAMSGNTKDLYARFKILLADKLKKMKREIYNFCALLIPWEIRIKEIESRFGSVVASYFIFLRWLFWVNIVIANIFTLFVIVPEVLSAIYSKSRDNEYEERKQMLEEERKTAMNFLTVWDFEGHLKYSPLFYGYYSKSKEVFGYHIPIAYFLAGCVVYIYSFFATLKKMADNSRNAKLGGKEDDCVFSWKLFTGWDFMIGHSETSANRVASVVMGFKEALLEEAEKQKDKKNWKIICLRIFANICVLILLVISAYAVTEVVKRSSEKTDTWWRRNEITVVMSAISFLFPMLFELLGLMEYYHPRMQLRLQLARIMILNLLNLYSLILALFGKIEEMANRLNEIVGHKDNQTTTKSTIEGHATETTTLFQKSKVTTVINDVIEQVTELYNDNNITEYANEEDYNYNNPDYFEVDTTTVTESTITNENSTFDFIANNASEIYENITDFIFDIENNTIIQNITDYVANLTSYIMDNSSQIMFNNTTNYNFMKSESLIEIESYSHQFSNLQKDQLLVQDNYANMNESTKLELRKLCWETMFGQELVKLTVMDLLVTVMQILMFDFFRALFVRYLNGCWCWDLEKRFPKYGDFKIAENILHLVNNQGMVWMGMFFSPGLALLNVVKLVLILYLRSWAVLTCNVPHEVVFRASRSNNFYLTLLLTMLFLCVLPVSYAIVWLKPSQHCGPFSGNSHMYDLFTNALKGVLPKQLQAALDYIASPAAIIPLLLLLILFIYYLISLTGALRMANQDLKQQLHKERTEERKKMMKLMEDKILDSVNVGNRMSNRWKKALEVSKPLSLTASTDDVERRRQLLDHAMKNILRKKLSNKNRESIVSIPKISLESEKS